MVTTVPFDHATPAAFLAHAVDRNNYYGYASSIADQALYSTRPEVLVGGGHPLWAGSTTYFSRAALDSLRVDSGWRIVERAAGVDGGEALLEAAQALPPASRLFGLFGGPGGSFETPQARDEAGNPGLIAWAENPSLGAAVTAAALVLSRDPEGFVLVAEQGDIDWASHAQDYPRMLGAVVSMDEAVRAICDFVDRPDDGITWGNSLLVVTADHATGLLRYAAPSVIGMGTLPASRGGGVYDYPAGSVEYLTRSHANELVSLSVMGEAASEAFEPYIGQGRPGARILDNTAIYAAMCRFLGLF